MTTERFRGRSTTSLQTVHTLSGRPIASEVHALFARYLELLLLWNRTQRLTGFESPAEIVRGLFEDSLLFWPLLPPRPLRMVDIGAGAGIPGIPLRIVDPGIRLTLIESRRKRVSFLKMITRELGLANDIVVAEGRAEVLVAELVGSSGAFDVAVARGVGSFESVLPIAQRYLVVGGFFIASGPPPARPPSVAFSIRCEMAGGRQSQARTEAGVLHRRTTFLIRRTGCDMFHVEQKASCGDVPRETLESQGAAGS